MVNANLETSSISYMDVEATSTDLNASTAVLRDSMSSVPESFNDSTSPVISIQNEWYWTFGTAILLVEFVLILALNGSLIILILKKGKRNKMQFFILHLAITDFMMAVFYILPAVVFRFMDEWRAGFVMCKITLYVSMTVTYASSYMLVALSVDRVYAIVFPLSVIRRGVWYPRVTVATVWVISAACGIQDLVYAGTHVHKGFVYCDLLYPRGKMIAVLVVLNSVINVGIPAVVVTVCYTWMICVIRKRERFGMFLSTSTTTGVKGSFGSGGRVKNDSNVINRAKLRSTKIAFVVVVVFVSCWCPFTMCRLLLHVFNVMVPRAYMLISLVLAPLNSVANPVVFLSFNYKLLKQRQTRVKTTSTIIERRFAKETEPLAKTKVNDDSRASNSK